MTDEQRAKCSAAQKGNTNWLGHHHSDESKAKISRAMMGNTRKVGYHNSEETRAKISVAAMGRSFSLETRAKLSTSHKGSVMSDAAKAKLSASNLGHEVSPETRAKIGEANWRGGRKVASHKDNSKRRKMGFVPLNKPFIGCEGHHVDKEQVIYMPKELHQSIYHRQSDGRGMAKINAIAYNFLFKQEVEVAMGRPL